MTAATSAKPDRVRSQSQAQKPQFDRFNSLWIGVRLGYIQRLTMASALSVGHPFALYSYDASGVRDVPDGVEVRDANEVLEYAAVARYFEVGWPALATDFFRYALQAKGLGYWVDLDLYFLKPVEFYGDYIFGWENERSINGAVLRLPANSEMVRKLNSIPAVNWRPPFYGPRKSAVFYWRRFIQGDIHPENERWGTFGPALLTHFAKTHRVDDQAKERAVFYPIRHADARLLGGPPALVERQFTIHTRAVHLWHSALSVAARLSPPAGSYLEAACRRLGIDP